MLPVIGRKTTDINWTKRVVSPFYFDVCNKDLRCFKNLAGLTILPVITKLTV